MMINPFVTTHKTVGTKRRSTITYYRREIEESSVSRGRAIIVSLGRGWRRPLSSARSNPGGDRVFLDVPVTDESPGKRSWKIGFNVSSLRVARLNCFGGAWAGVDLILPVSRHGTTFRVFFSSLFSRWKIGLMQQGTVVNVILKKGSWDYYFYYLVEIDVSFQSKLI